MVKVSKLCAEGAHDWCMNRSPEESHCGCRCHGPKISKKTPTQRLADIARIIENVEHRCMAADGPVTNTRVEMTDDEMRRIYRLAKGTQR